MSKRIGAILILIACTTLALAQAPTELKGHTNTIFATRHNYKMNAKTGATNTLLGGWEFLRRGGFKAITIPHTPADPSMGTTWPAYDAALKAANVPHEGYIYPGAVHGFNCDATPERYNKAAADLAWQRTIDWFNKYVRT